MVTMETELIVLQNLEQTSQVRFKDNNNNIMPPKAAKPKSTKDDNSKKSLKKGTSEENDSVDNLLDQPTTTATPVAETIDTQKQQPEQQQQQQQPQIEIVAPVEEVIDIKYEEPVLTLIIVENYEGDKDKGFFEGLGKANFKGGHTYEGMFHCGMMSGKGKYTWSNGIVYEGDFLNNEIIGTGKYMWPNKPIYERLMSDDTSESFVTYEGEVFKGMRHGIGIFKSANTPIVYNGEWSMGKRNGKGKMIYDTAGLSYYEGDWINNRKFGWGIRHYPTGNIYEGMWVNDVRHGEGTMRWFDKNQTYTGTWENGIQHGAGEHNWYLARVEMTQYSLRNTYYGNFEYGKRHGHGTFLYANGSKYEGDWFHNLKHGYGKFTYKDGSVYEGYFEDDKMTSSPTFTRNSKISDQISKIKTRIPSAGTTLNIHMLRINKQSNRADFQLNLDLTSILSDFDSVEKQNLESNQALKTIIRYLDLFKQIYRFYSQLGMDISPDNTYMLNRMQFWRFLKDCKVHINNDELTLMEFDRLLNKKMNANELHCPYDKILIREFLNYIVLTAYHLLKNKFDGNGLMISWCIEKLIIDNILPNSCNVQGYFYADTRKTLNVLTYMVKSYEIYRYLSTIRKKNPNDHSFSMRNFLSILHQFKMIDGKLLTTRNVVEILASDNPLVFDFDEAFNLEFEMCFLEFFEALIGCAIKSYENSQTLLLKEKSLTKNESKSNVTQQAVQPTLPNNTNSTKSIGSLNANTNTVPTKLGSKTTETDSLQKKKETEEVSAVSPSIKQDVTILINDETLGSEKNVDELRSWVERNNAFFSRFFPAALNYELSSNCRL